MQNFIYTKTEYDTFKTYIAERTQAGTLTASDIILYNAIRNKPLTNGFTPRTNPGRINAIGGEWNAFSNAKRLLAYPFRRSSEINGIPITEELIKAIFPDWIFKPAAGNIPQRTGWTQKIMNTLTNIG